jgi:O-antigen/teichoic acid export membrane protein
MPMKKFGITKIEAFTMANRVFNLLASLAIVLMNLHFVKVEGQGVISLINFGILILATSSQFIGGGALIYLLPKTKQYNFAFPALIWIACSALFTWGVLAMTHSPHIGLTLILGILQALFIFDQMILLGKAEVGKYQALLFTQTISSLVFIFLFYFFTDWGIAAFLFAQLTSFLITAFVGTLFTLNYLRGIQLNLTKDALRNLVTYGGYAQMGNLLHLGNQRSYLYFLKNFGAEGNLLAGAFSLLLYIAESFWSVIKSLSAILASKSAQDDDHHSHVALTKRYISLGLFAVSIGCVAFYFLPNYLLESYIDYPMLTFKKAFAWLVPGIIANVFTVGYAHLFSGKGLYKNNFYSAAVGLTAALIASAVLIPQYKLIGATFSASLAFTLQAMVQFVLYRKWKNSI